MNPPSTGDFRKIYFRRVGFVILHHSFSRFHPMDFNGLKQQMNKKVPFFNRVGTYFFWKKSKQTSKKNTATTFQQEPKRVFSLPAPARIEEPGLGGLWSLLSIQESGLLCCASCLGASMGLVMVSKLSKWSAKSHWGNQRYISLTTKCVNVSLQNQLGISDIG